MSFSEVASMTNLMKAGYQCCRGNRWKKSTQMFEFNMPSILYDTHVALITGNYYPKPTYDFTIDERGKKRLVRAHSIVDRTVYKSFCQHELFPAVETLIIPNNSASQIGKGTEYAIKRFRADLAHATRVCGMSNKFYVLVFDYSNYFGSIPHKKIKKNIGRRIEDERSRELFNQYVDLFDDEGNKRGIGIGGEPSQIIAIVYPHQIDRYFCTQKDVLGNGRYMDDGYIIAKSKSYLQDQFLELERRSKRLGLKLNYKRTKIYDMSKEPVTFLKKKTLITDTGKIVMMITRKNVNNEIRRLKYYYEEYKEGRVPLESIQQSMTSWLSYANNYHSYYSIELVKDLYFKYFGDELGIDTKNVYNFQDI